MTGRYIDLIQQTFDFPQAEFDVRNNQLYFHDVSLMDIVAQYGSPLKLSYLPRISDKIHYTKKLFQDAIKEKNYNGKYTYCYCTKSSHFSFVLEKALENDIHIETSSAFDIGIVKKLHDQGKLSKDTIIVCNGFKRPLYTQYISELINEGYQNCMPVLDNLRELEVYEGMVNTSYNMGIRVAADEIPNFEFYTSRLGIRYSDIIPYYNERIKNKSKGKLKMLHFFINTGIRDDTYYWNELNRFVQKYCDLKKECPELDTLDIGGGFPIKNSLTFDFDYEYMVNSIIDYIKDICDRNEVPHPNIFTEFGSFTVGESGVTIYSILDQKLQNDKELWYMIDGSFITHLPDSWGMNQKFILLPLNFWDREYHKVNIGGLTCDSMDYYNSEAHSSDVFLPKTGRYDTLYIAFFHTGAYQESLGGYGGIQHCLIPAPQHVLIDRDASGRITTKLFREEQENAEMLKILGY